jgi:Ca2+-binding EF-hand superfamily protein
MKKFALLAAAGLIATGFASTAAFADDSFTKADANTDGKVSMAEAMGVYPTLTQDIFNQADANKDGSLDQAEFTALEGLTAGQTTNGASSSSAAQ